MLTGFMLAAYAIVANDAIQTLGTFLSSNRNRPWWVLWLYASTILTTVMVYGWFTYGGDVSYGRLVYIEVPKAITWIHVIPPLILLFLTRNGFPVSTTFLILTVFSQSALGEMLFKSILGYVVAFGSGLLIYWVISRVLEEKFVQGSHIKNPMMWSFLQWVSTGLLWSQWLIQDLANIFVYLPRQLRIEQLGMALVLMLGLHAVMFKKRGGSIQSIVTSKTNTGDVRSATIINFVYGGILFFFVKLNAIPMSTTWVFIGLLAGREVAIRVRFSEKRDWGIRSRDLIAGDLIRAGVGLVISVATAFLLNIVQKSEPMSHLVPETSASSGKVAPHTVGTAPAMTIKR